MSFRRHPLYEPTLEIGSAVVVGLVGLALFLFGAVSAETWDDTMLVLVGTGIMFLGLAWGRDAWRRARQQYRFQRRLCQRCGYPMRGLHSPRCPECGALLPLGIRDHISSGPQ